MRSAAVHKIEARAVPPVIVITNPAITTVSQPVIQLQGYANEPLASLFYDVTNASGSFSNLEGSVVGQWLDTNTLRLTTNWFQCYDLALTNGANLITLHAIDLAGNVTTTNLTLTLDYGGDTNAPEISVSWPGDNALVAGTNFTLHGIVDDPTVHVSVSIGSDTFEGVVERDGQFRVGGLPLAADTNSLTVIATDTAGNTRTRSWTVRKSTEQLTLNPVTPDQLTGSTVTLTGTVGVSGHDVWVFGVQASVSNNNWTATVPTPVGGVAHFEVSTGSSPSNATASSAYDVESPPRVRAVSFSEDLQTGGNTIYYSSPPPTSCGASANPVFRTRNRSWQEGRGDNYSSQHFECTGCGPAWPSCDFYVAWPTNWPGGETLDGTMSCSQDVYTEESVSAWQNSDWDDGIGYSAINDLGCRHFVTRFIRRVVRTGLELSAGGSAGDGQRLIRLTAHADAYSTFGWPSFYSGGFGFNGPGSYPVSPSSIRILGLALTPTATNANVGEMYVAMEAGTTKYLPVWVLGENNYSFDVQAEEVKMKILANGIDLATNTPEFCVGQQVTFTLTFDPPVNYVGAVSHWHLPDKFVNEAYQDTSEGSTNYRVNFNLLTNLTTSCWFVNGAGGRASIGSSLLLSNGHSTSVAVKGSFTVYRPSLSDFGPGTNVTLVFTTNSAPVVYLGLGNDQGGGMRWDLNVNLKTNYLGFFYYDQLVKRDWSWDEPYLTGGFGVTHYSATDGEFWLDKGSPYTGAAQVNLIHPRAQIPMPFEDGPSLDGELFSFADLSDTFRTYLRFRPSGGIPITLGRIDWSWHGAVHWAGGAWSLTSTNIAGPSLQSDDALPEWTDIYPGLN